jgi:hypothetical protein
LTELGKQSYVFFIFLAVYFVRDYNCYFALLAA